MVSRERRHGPLVPSLFNLSTKCEYAGLSLNMKVFVKKRGVGEGPWIYIYIS